MFFFAALVQMGYRLSPQFSVNIVYRYDTTRRQRLSLDNYIEVCVLLKSLSDSFKLKDTAMRGVIQIGYEEFLNITMINRFWAEVHVRLYNGVNNAAGFRNCYCYIS